MPGATVLICEKFTPSVDRSILKPVSVVELSCQLSMICVAESGDATRLVGAAGAFDVCAIVAASW